MSDERYMQGCHDFLRAVARLREAVDAAPTVFVRDALLQRFEFCWELGWKAGKGWLLRQGVTSNTPRAVYEGLLSAGILEDGNRWSHLQRLRNLTSHTYDEALAEQVAADLRSQGVEDFEKFAAHVKRWVSNP